MSRPLLDGVDQRNCRDMEVAPTLGRAPFVPSLVILLVTSAWMSAVSASEDGLLLYYPCDEKSGTVLKDAGPNHKDGKLNAEPNGEVRGTVIVFKKADEWQPILTEDGIQRKGLIAGSDAMLAEGERPIVLDRDKDYAIDSANGRIKALSGGRIESGQSVTLDFRFTNSGPVWVEGKIGGGLKLDGVDDYVTLGQLGTGDSLTTVTFELWLYLLKDSPSHGMVFAQGSGGKGWWLRLLNGKLLCFVPHENILRVFHCDYPLPHERWHHLALSYDGQLVILYMDGREVARQSASGGPWNTKNAYYVGGSQGSFLGGIVDEIKIYNRAKSAEEIAKDVMP